MAALVKRDDLSQRTALSKSALVAADLCGHKGFYDIHARRFIPSERVTFGSAIDAGVEVIIAYRRMDQPVPIDLVLEAASFVCERDGIDLNFPEVRRALEGFENDVAPRYDWALAETQLHVSGEMEGLGEVDGHPDIRLRDGRVWDVKASGKTKGKDRPLELGFYAVLVEAITGTEVPSVGYINWIRPSRKWEMPEWPVTDDYRQWAIERAAAYVRAKRTDEVMNRNLPEPVNWSFPAGPKYPSLCLDCPYSPALGGACPIAVKGEIHDNAA